MSSYIDELASKHENNELTARITYLEQENEMLLGIMESAGKLMVLSRQAAGNQFTDETAKLDDLLKKLDNLRAGKA